MSDQKRKIVAVDFDGTLCKNEFPEIGIIEEIHEEIIDLVKRLKAAGHCIILWTCRINQEDRNYLDEALAFCEAVGIEFDHVNDNPTNAWPIHPRKIYADIYLDDRALHHFDYKKLEGFLK